MRLQSIVQYLGSHPAGAPLLEQMERLEIEE